MKPEEVKAAVDAAEKLLKDAGLAMSLVAVRPIDQTVEIGERGYTYFWDDTHQSDIALRLGLIEWISMATRHGSFASMMASHFSNLLDSKNVLTKTMELKATIEKMREVIKEDKKNG